MGCPIGTDNPTTVNGQSNIQPLQTDIMNQLIITSLEEGGVDGNDRLVSFTRQSGGKGEGVLFCNPHIVVFIRKAFGKGHQA